MPEFIRELQTQPGTKLRSRAQPGQHLWQRVMVEFSGQKRFKSKFPVRLCLDWGRVNHWALAASPGKKERPLEVPRLALMRA
jgi:hypothetical protein